MKGCLNEGILQSYLDGELSLEKMESTGAHLASCLNCRLAARELENDGLLLAEALQPQFSLSVPTDRLRHRIDAAISQQRLLNPPRPELVAGSSRSTVYRLFRRLAEVLCLSPQRTFGYASLAAIVLFAISFMLLRLGAAPAALDGIAAVVVAPVSVSIAGPDATGPVNASVNPTPTIDNSKSGAIGRRVAYRAKPTNVAPANDQVESAHAKLLPGERSYIKTIAELDTSLRSDGNLAMRPALQSEYERNLAMLDRAIAATRNAAKSNPNNPDAAEFMYAAYQTKVDFLNQIADSRLVNPRR